MWRNFTSQLPFLFVILTVGVGYLVVRPRLSDRIKRAEPLLLLVAWGIGMAAVTLLPLGPTVDANNHETYRLVELNPAADFINSTTGAVTWRVGFEQIVGNLILFFPAGVAMGMLATRGAVSMKVAASTGPVIGLAIETLQWVLPLGRVASTADAIVYVISSSLGLAVTVATCRAVRNQQTRRQRGHANQALPSRAESGSRQA